MSLTDSVLDFPEEFGRTYHAYRAGCRIMTAPYLLLIAYKAKH